MINKVIASITSRFVSPDEVEAYRTMIPRNINVGYRKDRRYYVGYINEVDGVPIKGALVTQGKNEEEFITNVNQLVYAYMNMPERIRPYYGNTFKPAGQSLQKSGELELAKA